MIGAFAISSAEPGAMDEVRALFREYEQAIKTDLCFQGFEAELADLPGKYAAPSGALFLVREKAGEAIGCVALRDMGDGRCEMKRLYVKPSFRKANIGHQLVETVISEARRLGYAEICLDTLPDMTSAQALYRKLGFRDTVPYYNTPVTGTLFMA